MRPYRLVLHTRNQSYPPKVVRPYDVPDEPNDDCLYESDGEYNFPEGETNLDKAKWGRYLQFINHSDGFDIEDFPGVCWWTSIVPLPNYNLPPYVDDLNKMAIRNYNKQHPRTKYTFLKLVKANSEVCSGLLYYITFLAKRKRYSDVVETFQARVWDKVSGEIEVQLCRIKKTNSAEGSDAE